MGAQLKDGNADQRHIIPLSGVIFPGVTGGFNMYRIFCRIVLIGCLCLPSRLFAQGVLLNGTISTAGTDCAVATNCAVIDTNGVPSFAVYVDVSTSGTFNFEASVDATSITTGTWFAVTDDVGGVATLTADGVRFFTNPGYRRFRVRASAISGTAAVRGYRGETGMRSTATLTGAGDASAANQTSQITQETAINTVLGLKTDAKSTATDATAISAMQVLKEISAMAQSPASTPVTGTFWQAAQPTSVAAGSDITLGNTTDTAAADANGTVNAHARSAAANLAILAGTGVAVTNTPNVVATGTLTNNSAAPAATNFGVLGCLASTTAGAQSWTTGRQTLAECLLTGELNINVSKIGGSAPSTEDPCVRGTKVYLPFSQATSTQLLTGTASNRTYVCHFDVQVGSAENLALVSGTGTVCGTSVGPLIGGTTAATGWLWTSTNGGGISLGNGGSAIAKTDTDADNVCLLQTGTVRTVGLLTYVVLP